MLRLLIILESYGVRSLLNVSFVLNETSNLLIRILDAGCRC